MIVTISLYFNPKTNYYLLTPILIMIFNIVIIGNI